ncbi:MAG TPA: hypothetical protein VHI98_05485, partial [Vicinamibacterales bacterium]|nr:hypothetical protein [Vicinamibacterales bacterium]
QLSINLRICFSLLMSVIAVFLANGTHTQSGAHVDGDVRVIELSTLACYPFWTTDCVGGPPQSSDPEHLQRQAPDKRCGAASGDHQSGTRRVDVGRKHQEQQRDQAIGSSNGR